MRKLLLALIVSLGVTYVAAQTIGSIIEAIQTENEAFDRDAILRDTAIAELMSSDPDFANQDMFESKKGYLSRITASAPKLINLFNSYTLPHLIVLDSLRMAKEGELTLKTEFLGYDNDSGKVSLNLYSPEFPGVYHEYYHEMAPEIARYIYTYPDSLFLWGPAYPNIHDQVAFDLVMTGLKDWTAREIFQGNHVEIDASIYDTMNSLVCFSDDGRSMALNHYGTEPNVVYVMRNSRTEYRFNATGPVTSMDLSPDGRLLAVGVHTTPEFGTDFWVIDVVMNEILLTGSVDGGVTSVDISPDGRLLVIGGGYTFVASTAQIYEISTGRMLLDFSDSQVISAVKFSPDQRYVASTGISLAVWDLLTQERYIYQSSGKYVSCVAFHPNGKTLVTGENNGGFRLYDLETKTNKGYEGSNSVHSLSYDFLGRYLALGMNQLKVLNLKKFHYSPILDTANGGVFKPGSRILVTKSKNYRVGVW